jgi:hypothetical protein
MSKKKAHLNKIKYNSTGKIDITASGLGTADRVTRFSKQGVLKCTKVIHPYFKRTHPPKGDLVQRSFKSARRRQQWAWVSVY